MNVFLDPMKMYNEPRETTDIDLIDSVRKVLIQNGLDEQVKNAFDTHHFIQEAVTKRPLVQQYFLNRYWNIQLMSCEINTFEQRSNLILCSNNEDWLNLFINRILPFVVNYKLPKVW